jgi:hypothetical protein
MAIVTFTLAVTATSLPSGVTFEQYDYAIALGDNSGEQQGSIESTALTVTFPDDVPPGDYLASVEALDTTSNRIGTALSTPFTVPEPTYGAPTSVTVTFS